MLLLVLFSVMAWSRRKSDLSGAAYLSPLGNLRPLYIRINGNYQTYWIRITFNRDISIMTWKFEANRYIVNSITITVSISHLYLSYYIYLKY